MQNKNIRKIVSAISITFALGSLSVLFPQQEYSLLSLSKFAIEKTLTLLHLDSIYKINSNSDPSVSTNADLSTSSRTASPYAEKNNTNSIDSNAKSTTSIPLVSSILAQISNVQASSKVAKVASEDEFYKLIVSQVSKGEDVTINLGNIIDKNNIGNKIIGIIESSGYSGYISGIDYGFNGDILSVKFKYKGGKDEFLSKSKIVDAKVQEIVSSTIKPGMSDFDKEFAIHNYIINNTTYDYKNFTNNTLPDDSFTAYGVLIKGTAVCNGYAEAMYRLLNSAGIKTLIVTGTADKVDHAWNMVYIDGSYYHVDATFDDPVSNSGNTIVYNYFNVTDSEISRNHTWNAENFPKCTSTSANYFVFSKLTANNRNEFYNIIKQGLLNKQSIIRVKTASYNTSIFSSNVLNDVLKDNPKINYLNTKKGFSYSYAPESAVMEFYINYK